MRTLEEIRDFFQENWDFISSEEYQKKWIKKQKETYGFSVTTRPINGYIILRCDVSRDLVVKTQQYFDPAKNRRIQ